jgi:hypothetical protein
MPIYNVTVPTDLHLIESEADGSVFGVDQPDEPETRDPIFTYNAGDIPDATWAAMLSSMPTNATSGNPQPNTQNYGTATPVAGTQLDAIINREVPTMSSGRLYASVSTASHAKHSLVRPRTLQFLDNWYLKSGILYRFDMTFDLVDSIGWANSIAWGIVFELWGTYSSAWRSGQHPLNPPFSIYAINQSGLKLVAKMYGSSSPSATAWEYENSFVVPLSLGSHNVSVWWKKDHRGLNSYCKVKLGANVIGEVTNVKLGTPFDSNGNVPLTNRNIVGGVPQFGMYTEQTFAPPGVECYFDKFEVYRPVSA